jgi:predicted site-specific integrase-resolvase
MLSEKSGDEKLLTKGEVARLCRVDIRTVDRWLMAGKVGYHRTPSGRVLFRKHDVLKVVANGQSSAPAAAIVDSAPPAGLPAPASE